jgi:hypothetical protein
MGWGEKIGAPEGHAPPVLTTSQRITQQSIERSTAADLANMVRMYLADGTTGNREAMAQALKEYERVRGI